MISDVSPSREEQIPPKKTKIADQESDDDGDIDDRHSDDGEIDMHIDGAESEEAVRGAESEDSGGRLVSAQSGDPEIEDFPRSSGLPGDLANPYFPAKSFSEAAKEIFLTVHKLSATEAADLDEIIGDPRWDRDDWLRSRKLKDFTQALPCLPLRPSPKGAFLKGMGPGCGISLKTLLVRNLNDPVRYKEWDLTPRLNTIVRSYHDGERFRCNPRLG